jgi:hypothetical protein
MSCKLKKYLPLVANEGQLGFSFLTLTVNVKEPMKKVITIFLFLCIFSCVEQKKKEINAVENPSTSKSNFDLIENFETNKTKFNTDTFNLNEHSTDGGELTVFHSSKMNYLVLDFWLYGETGKLNYTYWTDKELKFKFIKQVKYKYDKPYYEVNFKIDTNTNYMSYLNPEIKLFDKDKNEITDKRMIDTKEKELKSFFNDVTRGIEIIK